jgi:hypothetical protein
MISPIEKSFCVMEYAKTTSRTSVQRASGNGFIRIHLLENLYRDALTTLKPRDGFVRRKAVAVLLYDEAVRQVEATFYRSPRRSVRKENLELRMPKKNVWQFLHRRVRMEPYNAML